MQEHTILDTLSAYINDHHSDWDEYVLCVTFALNMVRQDSTGEVPFYLLHKRMAILPHEAPLDVTWSLCSTK